MTARIEIITFNLTGEKTIAPSPAGVRHIRTYVRNARTCGLSDAEIASDVAYYWPNARRTIAVETDVAGDVRVLFLAPRTPPPAVSGIAAVRAAPPAKVAAARS